MQKMASQKEIASTYDYMDRIFRKTMGDHGDITGAMYNGDFTLTLEEAQEKKHEYILNGIGFRKGDRILDIGCGWGPMLKAIKYAGGREVGLTVSPAQANNCKAKGFYVELLNWKDADPKILGKFDGLVSVGAFEAFCSVEELLANRQEDIYIEFFRLCHDLLKDKKRLYLQTMMWGKKVPFPSDLDITKKKLSDEWVLGYLARFYPGSWLPNNLDQIQRCASPYFKLVSENNGRLDYIQTLKEWGDRISRFSLSKFLFELQLVPRYITNKNFRQQITSLRYSCNRLCFEREIMSHQRLVFERIDG
jgi:cyclopropane-fatty-acyl-phospholipid synthase